MDRRNDAGKPGDVVPGTYRECNPPKLVTFDRNTSGYVEPGILLAWRQQLGGDLKPYWHGLITTPRIRDQAVTHQTFWLWDPKIHEACARHHPQPVPARTPAQDARQREGS